MDRVTHDASSVDTWLEHLAAAHDIETGDPAGWLPSWDTDRWELGPEPEPPQPEPEPFQPSPQDLADYRAWCREIDEHDRDLELIHREDEYRAMLERERFAETL
jgi:hypothetical protein